MEKSRSLRSKVAALLAGVAIIASGTIIACSDGPVGPEAPRQPLAAKEARALGPLTVASAGAYHNAFLDFSFPKVRSAIRMGADHKRACKVIAQAMREFVVKHRIAVDPRGIGDDIAGSRCASREGRAPAFSLMDDGQTSPEFDAIVAEMAYAVEVGQSPGELAALFDHKVAYARANLPEAEAEVIAVAASVGLSSVEYWNANYVTQYEALSAERAPEAYHRLPSDALLLSRTGSGTRLAPPGARFSMRASAIRVGAADLKGAVHGGISGIRGGWAGVLAGAVIEGGGKSAGALLGELFR
ncbi:MAG: hypothetical protein ABIP09_05410 [Gemmatimonadaceae bacterium]